MGRPVADSREGRTPTSLHGDGEKPGVSELLLRAGRGGSHHHGLSRRKSEAERAAGRAATGTAAAAEPAGGGEQRRNALLGKSPPELPAAGATAGAGRWRPQARLCYVG